MVKLYEEYYLVGPIPTSQTMDYGSQMPKDFESIDTIIIVYHLKAVPRMCLHPCLHFEVDATKINIMHLHS